MPIDSEFEFDRRRFIAVTGVATLTGTGAARAASGLSETSASSPAQPAPTFKRGQNTADILVAAIITWGAKRVFGIVGDGINPIVEALRKRRDEIAFISVRHEEAAAFMASAHAKFTGTLGVCLATTGPGAVHLLNGLYDARFDNAPVLAITGSPFHDLEGMRFMQGVDTVKLMQDVALFDEQVNGPAHMLLIADRACRAAMAGRGIAHLTIPKDYQLLTLSEDKPSPENHGGRTSSAWSPLLGTPVTEQLRAAADVLNAGRRIAILAGAGCFSAKTELRRAAESLGAPIAKAYLAKALLPDDDPLTTGGIGHLGTLPSQWIMQNCDTVLILGSMMPWIDYYPKPGQARGVQVDVKSEHIGLKYPVEIGLTGEVGATLRALQPLLDRKTDRGFLDEAQARMRDWNRLLGVVEGTQRSSRPRPQTACRMLSDLAPSNAVYAMDCGANTHFAARHIRIKEGQGWSGSGTLVSMASGLPYAVAAAFAYPGRSAIAVVGDGGFAMLMAELSTAVVNKLNVKVMVLNNDAYGQVKTEQRDIGSPIYGCDLGHFDFAKVAEAAGARGFTATSIPELAVAMRRWLAEPGVAVLDVQVDSDEEALPPAKLRA